MTTTTDYVLARLAQLQADEDRLRSERHQLVAQLRNEHGYSWQKVGDTLGITKQGAMKVYGPSADAAFRASMKAARTAPPAGTADLWADEHGHTYDAVTVDEPAAPVGPSGHCGNGNHDRCLQTWAKTPADEVARYCGCSCHEPATKCGRCGHKLGEHWEATHCEHGTCGCAMFTTRDVPGFAEAAAAASAFRAIEVKAGRRRR